jgi:paraquat-inducible protein A
MVNSNYGISGYFPLESKALLVLLVVTAIMLAVGLSAPILTLEKFFIIENTFSIFSGLVQLLEEGRIFLFVIILLFSVVMPIIKLGVLFRLLGSTAGSSETLHRYLRLMHQYGKWSMLDVFVVALLVVAVKLGAVATVETHYGLYAFGSAVLLTMAITARVIYLSGKIELQP